MKKRRFKKSEKSEVLSVIANVNWETLYASIVSKISGMVHIAKIDERIEAVVGACILHCW